MKYFTQSHEWIEADGDGATVGISRSAQQELGDIVYVQLPKIGREVRAGEEACVLESTKAAVDVYSPASGSIIAINEAVIKDPSLINKDPESAGWLFRIKLTAPDELKRLKPS